METGNNSRKSWWHAGLEITLNSQAEAQRAGTLYKFAIVQVIIFSNFYKSTPLQLWNSIPLLYRSIMRAEAFLTPQWSLDFVQNDDKWSILAISVGAFVVFYTHQVARLKMKKIALISVYFATW